MGENVRGVEGLSPADVFNAERNPQVRETPDPRTLAMMLAERERRTVRENAVTWDKRRYVACDQESEEILHDWGGREVDMAFDRNDKESVAILDLDGRLLCWAKVEQLLPQSPEANALVAESMRSRRHLEKGLRESLTGLNRAVANLGMTTPLQDLHARAEQNSALPVAVGDVLTFRPTPIKPDNHAVAPASAAEIADSILARIKRK